MLLFTVCLKDVLYCKILYKNEISICVSILFVFCFVFKPTSELNINCQPLGREKENLGIEKNKTKKQWAYKRFQQQKIDNSIYLMLWFSIHIL